MEWLEWFVGGFARSTCWLAASSQSLFFFFFLHADIIEDDKKN
jgi:hypothetical protein